MKKSEKRRKVPGSPEETDGAEDAEDSDGGDGEEMDIEVSVEGEDEDDEVQKSLNVLVDELVGVLDMRDWKIKVQYCPDAEGDSIADVAYSIHREATVTVYSYRPDRVREDLLHELLHCKVGIARKGYEVVFEHQRMMIDELAQGYEEMFVDDLVRVVGKYCAASGQKGSRTEQLELFEAKKDE